MPDAVTAAKKLWNEQLAWPLDACYALKALRAEERDVSVQRADWIGSKQREEIFSLLERNMKSIYESSEEGWDSSKKRAELFHPASRFLILRDRGERSAAYVQARYPVLGFVMWRFDWEETMGDEAIEVAYCYELQISQSIRGQGYGSALMKCLEEIARSTRMKKIMLTVFRANVLAIKFYSRIGYTPDEISPSQVLAVGKGEGEEDDYDYEILSKAL